MGKRQDRRRLEVRRERLRQLTVLGEEEVARVAGGDTFLYNINGRTESRCCK